MREVIPPRVFGAGHQKIGVVGNGHSFLFATRITCGTCAAMATKNLKHKSDEWLREREEHYEYMLDRLRNEFLRRLKETSAKRASEIETAEQELWREKFLKNKPFWNFRAWFQTKYRELVSGRRHYWTGTVWIPQEWIDVSAAAGPLLAFDAATKLDWYVNEPPILKYNNVYYYDNQFQVNPPSGVSLVRLNLFGRTLKGY
jgi:hypothetical protein